MFLKDETPRSSTWTPSICPARWMASRVARISPALAAPQSLAARFSARPRKPPATGTASPCRSRCPPGMASSGRWSSPPGTALEARSRRGSSAGWSRRCTRLHLLGARRTVPPAASITWVVRSAKRAASRPAASSPCSCRSGCSRGRRRSRRSGSALVGSPFDPVRLRAAGCGPIGLSPSAMMASIQVLAGRATRDRRQQRDLVALGDRRRTGGAFAIDHER